MVIQFFQSALPLSQCRIGTAAAVYFKKLVFYQATRVQGDNCQSLPTLSEMASGQSVFEIEVLLSVISLRIFLFFVTLILQPVNVGLKCLTETVVICVHLEIWQTAPCQKEIVSQALK